MSLWVTADEEAETEQRRRFLDRLVELNGAPVRCARRIEGTTTRGSKEYYLYPDETPANGVHYRSIIQCQTVFDLGDNTPWSRTALEANALMSTLDALGIDYLPTLSGGKGLHVEVFSDGPPETTSRFCGNCTHPPHRNDRCKACSCVDPHLTLEDGKQVRREHPIENDFDEWRLRFHTHILSICPVAIAADPLLKAPNVGARLVRDFGQRKSSLDVRRKMLWPKGETLPDSRDEAYEIALGHHIIPRWVPVNKGLAERYSLAVQGCPKSPACLDPQSNGGWPGCGSCLLYN